MHRTWQAIVAALGLAGCGPLPDLVGNAAVELKDEESGASFRLRGPARFHFAAQGELSIAARFVRETPQGPRRSDLSIRLFLPAEALGGEVFRADPQGFVASYVERDPRQPGTDSYGVRGQVRLELRGPSFARAAVDFELHASAPRAGVPATLRLRGVISSDNPVVSDVPLTDLEIWVDFDPYHAWEDPDLDFDDYLVEAPPDEGAWATESGAVFLDAEAEGPEIELWDGPDQGCAGDDGESFSDSGCSGGDFGDDGGGCDAGDMGDSGAACEGGGGGGSDCSALRGGPSRTMAVLLVLLLAARWWRKRRSAFRLG